MTTKSIKLLTLCMVHKDGKLLLGMKKRGFGAGRWNGFGGKLNSGESIIDAALREMTEEVGITALDLEEKGIIQFEFENDPKVLEVHIFSVTKYIGEPTESEEMRPQWFDSDKIPYGQMWSDDIYWIPIFLRGKKFRGRFHFDQPSTAEYSAKILKHELTEVSAL